ncbi:aminotransferase class I/II-fold pyridoxal phosphate-dependent enzyme [Dickeya solani]|uniref:Aminotransferase class I/II-fold pyridoxal phosphate-dependent enzyme n=1 Tax=Dickeya solani TaxID=1089444 RepID=A0ABU4EBX3_9GAMM|nr:aminotransferase class I/II-fold pyridoxal phosphate-dependent enzyme [Dickeya solani]MCZ0823623.1 aminotransferase class I/II-fold pyridoxal phosphate-dependent enzyme [Dickeya solani]MDV6995499.1 aminotransferase class I/II-fold pyridoxal phosphate-dependent enzyme [Dickeya solani]MDV7003113.1 aminotransferase class I/II-fold pyridoxal phosphate-dependent enzyme [Dickeya solani]MDV7037979.1 aminotransferase class I/II-fold pyridoxal phosphate-dependent enzyme [Dickeya solani]MDV7041530.1 
MISLCAGEPDVDTPEHVCEAGIAAIRAGYTRYTQVAGLRSLRAAVAAKFQHDNGLSAAINQIPGLHCERPAGAFYAFVSCEALLGKTTAAGTVLNSDEEVATALLDEAGVAVVPGSAFGLGPYFRIAYALDDDALLSACRAIRVFCESLT